jgi:hypothetical protein
MEWRGSDRGRSTLLGAMLQPRGDVQNFIYLFICDFLFICNLFTYGLFIRDLFVCGLFICMWLFIYLWFI